MIVEAAAGSSGALETLSSSSPVICVLESGRSQAQRANGRTEASVTSASVTATQINKPNNDDNMSYIAYESEKWMLNS